MRARAVAAALATVVAVAAARLVVMAVTVTVRGGGSKVSGGSPIRFRTYAVGKDAKPHGELDALR